MDITTATQDNIVIVSLKGNFLGEQSSLLETLKAHLDAGQKRVLFNLSDMKFINSTGLGLLMTALTKARNAGGEMALCHLPDQLKKLLAMTKLETVFPVHNDVDAGIAFLKSV